MSNYRLEGQSWTMQPVTWDFAAATLPEDRSADPFSGVITQPDVQAAISTAFEAWSGVTNLRFVYAPQDSSSVDIRIGWSTFSQASNDGQTIGQTNYSYDTSTEKFVADTVIRLIDPSQLGLNDDGGIPTYDDGATLYQVVLHEIGHAIGLAHDTIDPFAVMYPDSSDANQQLAAVDIQGAQAIYGVPRATFIDIGAARETVCGTLSGAPSTLFGSSGALDYAGGSALIVLDRGSAQVHGGNATVFAGGAALAASNNQKGEFILGSGHASIDGGLAGSTDIVFGGSGGLTYAGAGESASVIGGTGSATIPAAPAAAITAAAAMAITASPPPGSEPCWSAAATTIPWSARTQATATSSPAAGTRP